MLSHSFRAGNIRVLIDGSVRNKRSIDHKNGGTRLKTPCSSLIIQLFFRGQEAGNRVANCSSRGAARKEMHDVVSRYRNGALHRGSIFLGRVNHRVFLSREAIATRGPVDIVSLRGDGGIGFAGHVRPTVKSSRIFWYFFAGGIRYRVLSSPPFFFFFLRGMHSDSSNVVNIV